MGYMKSIATDIDNLRVEIAYLQTQIDRINRSLDDSNATVPVQRENISEGNTLYRDSVQELAERNDNPTSDA